jgi:hypothetical protein
LVLENFEKKRRRNTYREEEEDGLVRLILFLDLSIQIHSSLAKVSLLSSLDEEICMSRLLPGDGPVANFLVILSSPEVHSEIS